MVKQKHPLYRDQAVLGLGDDADRPMYTAILSRHTSLSFWQIFLFVFHPEEIKTSILKIASIKGKKTYNIA